MSNLATIVVILLQIIIVATFGMLVFRNGRGNGSGYVVAAESSRPYELAAAKDQLPKATDLYEADIPHDTRLIELDRRALDEAYHNQLLLLWTTWLKQQAGDPTYFANGLRVARRAYAQAAEAIAKREKEIQERK